VCFGERLSTRDDGLRAAANHLQLWKCASGGINRLSLDYNFISAAARYGDHDDNCEETDLLLIRQNCLSGTELEDKHPHPQEVMTSFHSAISINTGSDLCVIKIIGFIYVPSAPCVKTSKAIFILSFWVFTSVGLGSTFEHTSLVLVLDTSSNFGDGKFRNSCSRYWYFGVPWLEPHNS